MRIRSLVSSSFALVAAASTFAACGGNGDEGQTAAAVASNAGGSGGSGGGQSGAAGTATTTGGSAGQSSSTGGSAGDSSGGQAGAAAGQGGSSAGTGGASAGTGGSSGAAGAMHSGVGDACTGMFGSMGPTQGSCTDGQACIPDGNFGFVDGYCIQNCTTDPCPSDSKCITVTSNIMVCMLSCSTNADCRTGYVCAPDSKVCRPMNSGGGPDGMGVTPGTNNGMACVMPVVDPPTPGTTFQHDQAITSGAMEAEVQLAADANGHVLVSWINIQTNGSAKIGYAMSADGGATFQKAVLLPVDTTVDKNSDQSDPVVAVDPMGNFYVSWVGFDRDPQNPNNVTNMKIWVARIKNDGTFDKLFDVAPSEWTTSGFLDKPWIAASPVDGTLYVTWDRASQSAVDIRMARSTDGGETWSTPTTISDTADRASLDRNLAQVTVGADGKAYVAWVEFLTAQFGSTANSVYFQRIAADGTKDGKNVKVTAGMDSPAFEDPSIAVAGSNVYVGFNSGTSKGDWDVRIAASLDGGDTFQPSVKANDDPTCATHFHHQIATDAKGDVHVLYYDNRYLVGNVFYQRSPAATATTPLQFGASEFVNSQSFVFTTDRASNDWLGDYLGLWVAGDKIYATWTDPRGGDVSHVYFAHGTIPLSLTA